MGKIYYLLLVLLVFYPLFINAQDFWQQTNGPYGGGVNALAVNLNGDIFAVTYYAGIFRSTNNGERWTPINEGLTDLQVNCLTIRSDGMIFTGTNDEGGIFFSPDNGNHWYQSGLFGIPITAISSNANGDIFAGTIGHLYNNTSIYRSTDNGQTWTALTNGLPPLEILSIAINSQGAVYLATNGGIYRSTDNGDNWEHLNLSGYCISLAINSSNHIFAGTGSSIYRSIDFGNTWDEINQGLPPNSTVKSIAINSRDHLFAGTRGKGVFQSLDNGNSWTAVNNGLLDRDILSLSVTGEDHIFTGTGGIGIFRSIDNGENWIESNTGLINTSIHDIAINANNKVFAGTVGLFSSTNNGNSWSRVGFPELVIESIAFNSTGHIFAGTSEQGIFRSTDDGTSWMPINNGLPPGSTILDILIKPNNYIFLATPTGVFRSTDNGNEWIEILQPLAVTNSVAMNSEGDIYIGFYPSIHLKGIYVSQDEGNNWSYLGLSFVGISSIAINSQDHIFAGSTGSTLSGIYRSTDGGNSWSQQLSQTWITDIAINSNGHLFASTWFKGVYKSEDNGDTWSQVISGLPFETVFSLGVNSNGYIFAGTEGGGVFRSIQSTTSIDKFSESIPSRFMLEQNYPNPFNPRTTIEFYSPRKEEITIEVFDILGVKVKTLWKGKVSPGKHSLVFEASELPSGVYVYRLTAPGISLTKKLVVLR